MKCNDSFFFIHGVSFCPVEASFLGSGGEMMKSEEEKKVGLVGSVWRGLIESMGELCPCLEPRRDNNIPSVTT